MSRSIEPSRTHTEIEAAAPGTGAAPVEAPGPDVSATGDAPPRTLYDRMKHLIGTVSFGPTDLAERHREYFMEGLLEKRRKGRL